MNEILLKLLMYVVPSLGIGPAGAIITVAVALGKEETSIMMPVVKEYIAEADDVKLHPEFTSGFKKFEWVFEQSIFAFPSANGKALGAFINIMVLEASVIGAVL
jgi:hypothetical protein